MSLSYEHLRTISGKHGLRLVGVTGAELLSEARLRLQGWQERGFAADLGYMKYEPERYLDPQRYLDGVRSVVSFGVYYDGAPPRNLRPGHGRIARYAQGRDYHKVVLRRLQAVGNDLTLALPDLRFRPAVDAFPLLERGFAERAGIGFIGKNSMVIRPGEGSYLFLAELLLSVEVEPPEGATQKARSAGCGSCTRCSVECPTNALVEPYTLDARRCISYLTIEKRGAFSLWEREAIGEWLFGCDRCQEVCPFNHRAHRAEREADLDELRPHSGVGHSLSLERVLSIRTHESFVDAFGGTPIMRARREGLLRNAAAVAANTISEATVPALRLAVLEDPAPLVRQHCAWALATIVRRTNALPEAELRRLLTEVMKDSADEVAREAEQLLA